MIDYMVRTDYNSAARRVQDRHPGPPGVVRTRSQLPGWRLLPRPMLGWDSNASRQSDSDQLGRQSLQCSWTSSLEL